jgi:hypothetical protein
METPSTTSITKAKGLGEGGTIGAPAAVINAINDALTPFGVEIDEMPATPQRIRAALRASSSPFPPRAIARGGEGSGVGGKNRPGVEA